MDPLEFNPERFLGDNPEADPRVSVFGYGRRICEYACFVVTIDRTNSPSHVFFVGPGIYIAQTSLWIACAMSLAVFDIEKYVDESGNVFEPETRHTDGISRWVLLY